MSWRLVQVALVGLSAPLSVLRITLNTLSVLCLGLVVLPFVLFAYGWLRWVRQWWLREWQRLLLCSLSLYR